MDLQFHNTSWDVGVYYWWDLERGSKLSEIGQLQGLVASSQFQLSQKTNKNNKTKKSQRKKTKQKEKQKQTKKKKPFYG